MASPEVAGRVAGLVAVGASGAPAADVDAVGTGTGKNEFRTHSSEEKHQMMTKRLHARPCWMEMIDSLPPPSLAVLAPLLISGSQPATVCSG